MNIAIDVARRRTTVIRAVATVAAVAGLGGVPATAAGATASAGLKLQPAAATAPIAVPGEIVVGFRSGVDRSERAAARSAADVDAERNLLAARARSW